MNADLSPRDASPPPYDKAFWAASVAFAAAPLILFLLIMWVFSGSEPQVKTVLSTLDSPSEALIAYAGARVGVVALNFGTYIFTHIILCLGATAYFFVAMRTHALAVGRTIDFEYGFVVAYAALVCAAVVVMTANRSLPVVSSLSVFSGLYVEPLRQFFQMLELDGYFSRFPAGTITFLYLSVLVPTLFGIVTVVAASAAFHHIVFSREARQSPNWQEGFVRCVTLLKRQLTVLSVILVSSVLTSRVYVNFMPSLVDPENKAAHGAHLELANALSFASGMLFTATLFAAFAPGAVMLLRDLAGIDGDGTGRGLHPVFEELKIANPTKQITALMRVVLTLVAPALAGPLMNVLSTAAA